MPDAVGYVVVGLNSGSELKDGAPVVHPPNVTQEP